MMMMMIMSGQCKSRTASVIVIKQSNYDKLN